MRIATVLLALSVSASAAPGAAAPKAFSEGHRVHYELRASDQFGMQFEVLPDLDADGIADLAFGAYTLEPDSSGVFTSGDLSIHSGRDGRRIRELAPLGSMTLYAETLADAGDIDGDGTHDLAAGMALTNRDQHRGSVVLISGRDGREIRRLSGDIVRQYYGQSVASVPDVDGDAVPELLVGAPRTNGVGRLYLHSGASGALVRTIDAPAATSRFGQELARLRDVDGDRVDDILVGAPTPDDPVPGRVFVYSGADYTQRLAVDGPADSLAFGARIGDAGDFDRDGRGDFYASDPSVGGTLQQGGLGRYRIYSGANGAVLFERGGTLAREQFGQPGESFDADGDGGSDFVVGRRPGAAAEAGSFQVLAGRDGRVLATYTHDVANDRIGSRTAPLADLDGDGRTELVTTTFGSANPRVAVVAGAVASRGARVVPAAHHSGLWVDPSHNGEGYVLEMLPDGRAAVYWFTYAANGTQRYLLGLGAPSGDRLVFDALLVTRGGRLGGAFDAGDVVLADRARLVISFDGCDSGDAEYTVDGEHGTQRLQRLSAIPSLGCGTASASAEDYSGAWFDPAHPGEGWIVSSIGGGLDAVLWFTYGDDGAQQWFTTLAPRTGGSLAASPLLRPAGGRFGPYFDPREVSRPVWGTLGIEFASCNAARVTWDGAARGSANLIRLTNLAGLSCVN